jgi:hypothetical protein
MAGSPLKRQRRKELRCIQPHIPMHQWRSFSDTEKIVAIFGMSLGEVARTHVDPFRRGRPSRTQPEAPRVRMHDEGRPQVHPRPRTRANARNKILEHLGAALRERRQDPVLKEPKSATNVITAASTSPPYNCSAASH